MPLSQSWMFTGFHPQKFDFLDTENRHYTWDLSKVWMILADSAPREVYAIEPSTIKQLVESGRVLYDVDKDAAMRMDLSRPIIVSPHPVEGADNDPLEPKIIIDGNHRLYRAYTEGVGLTCVFLTRDESRQCLVEEAHNE